MATLTFRWRQRGNSHEVSVTSDAPATLGRDPGCDLRLTSPFVHRTHARVRWDGDGFAIAGVTRRDHPDQRTQVLVNRRPITGEVTLGVGDTATLGDIDLRVVSIRVPALRLVWRLDDGECSHTVMEGESVTIGRHESCTIALPSPYVSRWNARIEERGGRCVITNLKGTNPPRLNEHTVTDEKDLNPGDVLRVGDISLHALPLAAHVLPLATRPHLVECPLCGRVAGDAYRDCPWCGTQLLGGSTHLPLPPLDETER